MLAGEFERKLRKLNRNLRVYCSNDDSKAAGLFYNAYGEYIEICGVDKNYVGEQIIWDNMGHIVRSGWRRVLNILISRKLVDKHQAEKVFDTSFSIRQLNSQQQLEDPILKMIRQATIKGHHIDDKGEIKPVYDKDEIVDIGREINKLKPIGV